MAAAALWGFAEATFFFIVPDVLLTGIAAWRGRRTALIATLWTVTGAVIGGALMFLWGAQNLGGIVTMLDRLPAISPEMIASARVDLGRSGLAVMIPGAFSGVPYKIYAAMAPAAGVGVGPFLAASVPIRALRFVAGVLIAAGLSRLLAARLARRQQIGMLAALWLAFYGIYFAVMPN